MPSHTSTHISGNGDAMPDPLCRLSIQHGPHTVDLALPRETPVGVLMPSIVDLVQRGGVAVDEGRQWQLSRVGQEWLDSAASLHDNAIRDGELLLLTTTATPAPEWVEDNPWHVVIDTADTGPAPTRVTATAACLCTAVLGATALVWSGIVTHATGHVLTGGTIASAAAIGAVAVIPPKANRKDPIAFDKDMYKARADVECTFKQARRFATRYEKRLRNYVAVAQCFG